jgi:hypothetical protein
LFTTGQDFLQTYIIKEACGNKDQATNGVGISKRANNHWRMNRGREDGRSSKRGHYQCSKHPEGPYTKIGKAAEVAICHKCLLLWISEN